MAFTEHRIGSSPIPAVTYIERCARLRRTAGRSALMNFIFRSTSDVRSCSSGWSSVAKEVFFLNGEKRTDRLQTFLREVKKKKNKKQPYPPYDILHIYIYTDILHAILIIRHRRGNEKRLLRSGLEETIRFGRGVRQMWTRAENFQNVHVRVRRVSIRSDCCLPRTYTTCINISRRAVQCMCARVVEGRWPIEIGRFDRTPRGRKPNVIISWRYNVYIVAFRRHPV